MKPHLRERSLAECTFVIVDLETTGGSPKNGCGITEIGAVKVRGGAILDSFESFVNPLTPIPGYITELTGITNAMVARAPIIDEALPEFLVFAGDPEESILVAHNSPFDMGFLISAANDCDILWPDYMVIDTVKLARRLLSRDEAPNCKLSTLAQLFETEVQPTHRALDDAKTTVDVLHGLFERAGSLDVFTFEGLLELMTRKSVRGKTASEYAVHWQIKEEFTQWESQQEF